MRRSSSTSALAAAGLFVLLAAGLTARVASADQGPSRESASSALRAEPSGRSATVVFMNRPIIVLRARVLGRDPEERAEGARRALDELASQFISGPVEWRPFDGGAIFDVAARGVLVITPLDIDELAGERIETVSVLAVARMQQALAEAVEGRTPRVLLVSSAYTVLLIALAIVILWGVVRLNRFATRKFVSVAEQTVARAGIADVTAVRASRLFHAERLVAVVSVAISFVVIFTVVGVILRLFPYTRPWGESMRGFLLNTLENAALGIAASIPGLLSVALIALIARFASRLVGLWFDAVEAGRLRPRWIYPETAQPTRRIFNGLLWVFAAVVAYPYLPGSGTDAFKGVSVFLGLMVTFGSSGLVNQIMSGFMITYSRALRVGDFVKIGDVEGTVTHLGVLSTKLLTLKREEATIPNAVVVAQTTTDYSRYSEGGVFTPTSVTIGYDAPWRQVHALLLAAAARTPGLKREPKPTVLQMALEDFYVRYTLFVCLERQESRPFVLDTLHANIQDLFNEYGVQIMSPNYMLDPAAPKVVPKKDWFAAPATPEQKT